MKTAIALPLMLTALGFAVTAWASPDITRTLTANPTVPTGAAVSVENLDGHMTVTHGARFAITATVVAGGDHAQALAQDVKLDVGTQNNVVTVHVDYPVSQYTSYRYPTPDNGGEVCLFAIFCGHSHSRLTYQGRRVDVYQGGDAGVPLHVDVAVTLPGGTTATLANAVGLLEAHGLANQLTLATDGSDIHASQISGSLTAGTDGGDLHVTGLTGNLNATTDGGDVYLSQVAGDMHLRTDGGDAHIDHATGALSADTDGGDLTLTDYRAQQGQLKASTDGGDVYLTQSIGDMRLDTDGGDVHATGATGSLTARTDGGDLYIKNYTSGSTLSVRSDGGDLHLAGNLAALRNLDVGTDGGDVIMVITNLSMHLAVSSSGGDISVHLPKATNVASSDNHFSATVGTAQGQGSVSSSGGNVTISSGA